jgi:N-acetylneuraminate synthase
MTNPIELASGRRIGPGQPCFLIAEAGSNWRMGTPTRDAQMARALVDVAVWAGCDAVKFQTYRASTVYVENAGESDYLAEQGIKQSMAEIFKDLEMPYEMIGPLAAYCRERGILFMSTPFSEADADAIDPFVELHKVASYEISHTTLQTHLARTGKPLICSTGAADLDDIDFAIDHLRKSGARGLALLQCTAKYPAPLEAANLRAITTLASRYGIPVGLSDHTREATIAPSAAVALGGCIIEKHFTLDNRLPGPDHPFAVTPSELKAMVDAVRATERSLGTGQKVVLEQEQELRTFARRGLQATRRIARGEALRLGDSLAILRPGKQRLGAHPRHIAEIDGRLAARDIPAGDGVFPEDAA